MPLTRSQLERLGERLRSSDGPPTSDDLERLDEFERSYDGARLAATVRLQELGLTPTARLKTVHSIVGKLRREKTALPRMQDIAGCRIVVTDVAAQDEAVKAILGAPWESFKMIDRRLTPSHGYRAVHVIAYVGGLAVEIQVRSRLQDLWAQLSEKLADRFGIEVKYGGGPDEVRDLLISISETIAVAEALRPRIAQLKMRSQSADVILPGETTTLSAQVTEIEAQMDEADQQLEDQIQRVISILS